VRVARAPLGPKVTPGLDARAGSYCTTVSFFSISPCVRGTATAGTKRGRTWRGAGCVSVGLLWLSVTRESCKSIRIATRLRTPCYGNCSRGFVVNYVGETKVLVLGWRQHPRVRHGE